jgi:hypothetical protein
MAIAARAREMEAEGRDVIAFAAGETRVHNRGGSESDS